MLRRAQTLFDNSNLPHEAYRLSKSSQDYLHKLQEVQEDNRISRSDMKNFIEDEIEHFDKQIAEQLEKMINYDEE